MMSDLSRSLLAAAREGLSPDPAVAARVRAKVAAATGAAAAGGASAAAVAVPKASSAALVVKITAALLAIGAVATTIVVAGPERTPPAPQLEVAPSEPTEDIRTRVRIVAPSDDTTSTPPTTIEMPPQHVSRTRRLEAVDGASLSLGARADESAFDAPAGPRTVKPDEKELDTISLAREVELIDLAMVSLRKRVPHAALEAIKAYNRETGGRGQMAEDAAAIEIEARCLQDQDVTALLDRFDHKWPESAQRERIQTTCFASK
jgi:hypothetical protein